MKWDRMAEITLIAIALALMSWPLWALKPSKDYETMHEKRVFTAPGCVVWQVTIRNEYGFDQIYVATTDARENRPTSAYPACRITH